MTGLKKIRIFFGMILSFMLAIGILVNLENIYDSIILHEVKNGSDDPLMQMHVLFERKYQVISETAKNQDISMTKEKYTKISQECEKIGEMAHKLIDSDEEKRWMEEIKATSKELDELYYHKIIPNIEDKNQKQIYDEIADLKVKKIIGFLGKIIAYSKQDVVMDGENELGFRNF